MSDPYHLSNARSVYEHGHTKTAALKHAQNISAGAQRPKKPSFCEGTVYDPFGSPAQTGQNWSNRIFTHYPRYIQTPAWAGGSAKPFPLSSSSLDSIGIQFRKAHPNSVKSISDRRVWNHQAKQHYRAVLVVWTAHVQVQGTVLKDTNASVIEHIQPFRIQAHSSCNKLALFLILLALLLHQSSQHTQSHARQILASLGCKGMEARKQGVCSFCGSSINIGDLLAPVIVSPTQDEGEDISNKRGTSWFHESLH